MPLILDENLNRGTPATAQLPAAVPTDLPGLTQFLCNQFNNLSFFHQSPFSVDSIITNTIVLKNTPIKIKVEAKPVPGPSAPFSNNFSVARRITIKANYPKDLIIPLGKKKNITQFNPFGGERFNFSQYGGSERLQVKPTKYFGVKDGVFDSSKLYAYLIEVCRVYLNYKHESSLKEETLTKRALEEKKLMAKLEEKALLRRDLENKRLDVLSRLKSDIAKLACRIVSENDDHINVEFSSGLRARIEFDHENVCWPEFFLPKAVAINSSISLIDYLQKIAEISIKPNQL